MGQVESIQENAEGVTEILSAAVTREQVAKVRKLIESFMFTTSFLLAVETALREQYNDAAAEELIPADAPAVMADIVGGIIRAAAEQEATEI